MKIETITTDKGSFTRITAENDTYLTNGEVYTELNSSVDLGVLDSPSNWSETAELPPEPELPEFDDMGFDDGIDNDLDLEDSEL